MIDYRTWKKADVKVTSLELDARNPRIPPSPTARTTRDLIAELVENEDVLSLAESIADEGYFPHERLIAMQQGGKSIVLEGNQRLAALRLLINPDAAPEAYKKKFRALAADLDLGMIESVPVVFAPSRNAAAPLIARRHTVTQVSKWSPVQQARYYWSLIDSGMTVEEAAKAGRRPQSEVADFLRMGQMYEVACSLEGLRESVRAVVHNPKEFPLTNLKRALDVPATRAWLGIDFDDSGNLVGKIDVNEFKKGITRIVSDVATGAFNSREHNTTPAIEAYLKEIEDAPNKRKKGKFTSKDLLKSVGGGNLVSAQPPRTKPRTAKRSRSIVPTGFKCYLRDQRICEIFIELKKLRLDKFTNSAAVMFRVFFELSVGYYLDKSGKIKPVLEEAKHEAERKGQRPAQDWYPPLSKLLPHVLEDPEIMKEIHPLAMKALRKIISDKDHYFRVERLDSFVHNRFVLPNERELRNLWSASEDLLRVLMIEYKPAKATGAKT